MILLLLNPTLSRPLHFQYGLFLPFFSTTKIFDLQIFLEHLCKNLLLAFTHLKKKKQLYYFKPCQCKNKGLGSKNNLTFFLVHNVFTNLLQTSKMLFLTQQLQN